jgi:hypothetical protein
LKSLCYVLILWCSATLGMSVTPKVYGFASALDNTGVIGTSTSDTYTGGRAFNAAIDVSPDGKCLVFSAGHAGHSNLYTLDLTSTRVTQLTSTPLSDNNPGFSPDGKSVVFDRTYDSDADSHIMTIEISTHKERQLTHVPSVWEECPSYSQDNKIILFGREKRDPMSKELRDDWYGSVSYLYSIKLDGSHLTRLSDQGYNEHLHPQSHGENEPIFYQADKAVLSSPSSDGSECVVDEFSPLKKRNQTIEDIGIDSTFFSYLFHDGHHVLLVADREHEYPNDLYVADINSKAAPICLHASRGGEQLGCAVVTADGKHIYFLIGYESQLWEIDTNGKNEHQIAHGSLFSNPLGR